MISQPNPQLWKQCMAMFERSVNAEQYNTWFTPLAPQQWDDEKTELTIGVPSHFFYEYIEEHFIKLIHTVIRNVFGTTTRIYYCIVTDKEKNITTTLPSGPATTAAQSTTKSAPRRHTQELDPQLNAEYSFDNFVEGEANRLCRSVGLALAENPKQSTFNPLFIWGPSGVGKTHLLNAIGNELHQRHPSHRVLYLTAHTFEVQYMESIRNNTFNDFINFYQSIDTLMLDDVQEFACLKGTQNTFFHIFNHLKQNGKQIVLTSDRNPSELQGMEDRLITRFKWGLTAEMKRPGEELRRNILLSHIKRNGLHIPVDVVNYISNTISDSVRDLEGSLNSLMAYSVVFNRNIDLTLAKQVLGHTMKAERKNISIDQILQQTSIFFQVDINDLCGPTRKANVVLARQVAMYLAQKNTDLTTNKIGLLIGNRNHATVIHSINSINDRLDTDQKFRSQMDELEMKLREQITPTQKPFNTPKKKK